MALLTRLRASALAHVRCASAWGSVPLGPPDAIFGLVEAFKADPNPNKINLGVGAYRDDQGKPVVLSCIRKAEEALLKQKLDKEYFGITGSPQFNKLSAELALGKTHPAVVNNLISTTQAVSGTGALRVGAEFIARFHKFPGGTKEIYMPNPTWANHLPIFRDAGVATKQYRYYNKSNCGLDFAGMLDDLTKAPEGSAVLLHACAHNPTGVDLNAAQWKELSVLLKKRNLLPFVDMAYQGFATGDADRDATAVRQLVTDGHNVVFCQSYSKNMGLYGERVGAFSVVCNSDAEVKAVDSQLKIIIRPMYSNPPIHGARLATAVLSDPALNAEWKGEVKAMADRIISARHQLADLLKKKGSVKDWTHVTSQIGMFCFSGLTPEQVEQMQKKFAIYFTKDGRISMVGVTSKNVEYLAGAIHDVTK